MNCLLDHIGIEGCGGSTPPSNLYINRLPGIELKAIDKLATPDQVNFGGVWNDIQERSIRKFKSAVNVAFKKRWKLKTITSSIDLGRVLGSTITPAAEEYRGIVYELNESGSDFANSNLQSIYIKSISFYKTSSTNESIRIMDLDTNEVIYTQSMTGSTGWKTLSVNQTFTENRIAIYYDSTNFDSTELNLSTLTNYNSSCGCVCVDYNNSEFRIRGAKTPISDVTNIEFGSDTYGVSAIISVHCAYDSIVCNNLPVFETALWYLEGAEFCFERRFTSRLNEFTTFDKNKAKELGDEYEKRFNEELELAIDGINLDGNDSCLVCNEQFRYTDARL